MHLSHLHQVPSAAQLGALGRVDVVMVPVDGAFTMDAVTMAEVIKFNDDHAATVKLSRAITQMDDLASAASGTATDNAALSQAT